MEYIVNECNKHAEKFKRNTNSPIPTQKANQNTSPPNEIKLEKTKEESPNRKKEEKKEEKRIESPTTAELSEPTTANILNKIMKTIENDDHGLDDHDIDQYINN